MPKSHPGAELDQPCVHRRCTRLDRNAQLRGRAPHQRPVPGRVGRRQRQQPPGLVGQGGQLAGEAILDPPGQRRGAGQAKPARQLRRGQPARQLQQRQRITTGLGDDQVGDPRVQRPGQRQGQQRPSVIVPEPLDDELRQPGQVSARIAGREHEPHRVGSQAARREPQRLHRRPIQPLLVIDHANQGTFPGHLRHQAQHRQAHQKPLGRRPSADPERGPQRIALRHRNLAEMIQERRAQLMQPRERQFHLRLHAHRTGHPAPARPPGQVVQQHGLAHARVTADHQCPALPGPDGLDQPVERVALADPVHQPRHSTRPPGIGHHRPGARPRRRPPGWARPLTWPPG